MKPPITAYKFGDLLILESVESAERYIEPIDVQNGEYVVYDSEGRLLKLEVKDGSQVVLRSTESTPSHAEELRQTIINLLGALGVEKEWLAEANLEELLEIGLAYKTE